MVQKSVAESIKTWSNKNLVSSQWSVLLFCAHWHRLRPPRSKGTFTNHHHPALPALCSQSRLSCTDTDCDIAHKTQETAYKRFAQLPWALSDGSNLSHKSLLLPLLSFFLTYPPPSCCQVLLSSLDGSGMVCWICCWDVIDPAQSASFFWTVLLLFSCSCGFTM